MQATQNSTEHDVLSIATGKYTVIKKHNTAKTFYIPFFAQHNNYIRVLMASKTSSGK